MKKQILHFGLAGPTQDSQATTGMTKDSIESQVKSGAQKARDTGLYDVQLTFIEPETFATSLGELRKELETGKWDALVIGGGLRMGVPLTPMFEQVVNTSREAAPRTKVLFQMAPGDIDVTVKRGFGE